MESIDRLRQAADELAQRAMPCSNAPDYADVRWKVKQLADAIEQEVGEMQRALTIDAKPMTDENMAESGWIRLPIDADGEVIHIGELVDEKLPFGGYAPPAPIDTMELSRGASGYRWMVKLDAENRALVSPKLLRHHHAPTVEDVLREFADAWAEWKDGAAMMNPVETFAAKLRLAGDGE